MCNPLPEFHLLVWVPVVVAAVWVPVPDLEPAVLDTHEPSVLADHSYDKYYFDPLEICHDLGLCNFPVLYIGYLRILPG